MPGYKVKHALLELITLVRSQVCLNYADEAQTPRSGIDGLLETKFEDEIRKAHIRPPNPANHKIHGFTIDRNFTRN